MSQKSLLVVIARRLGIVLLLAFAFEGLDVLTGFGPDLSNAASPQTSSRLREIVSRGTLADLRWPDFSDYKGHLAEFYESNGYTPAWVQGRQLSPSALALIQSFKDAWKKGLQPEDYDASRWDTRMGQLQSNDDPAPIDVALTVCTIRFVSDLRIGRVNPKHFRFGLSVEQKKYDLAQFIRDRLLSASDVSKVLDEVEPPFGGYRPTEAALARYTELLGKDDGGQLPPSARPIDPGQQYAGVPRLTQLLKLVGDFPGGAPPPAEPQLYDGAKVEAVKSFQRRHGLQDDGPLGAETLKQFNVPLSERVHQLQLTLERWRWLPAEFSAPPIIVNIPDFQLRALDEAKKNFVKIAGCGGERERAKA